MRRRTLLAGLVPLAGCSVLPAQPYLPKRDWPLQPRRPSALPPAPNAPVLLVRPLQAGPGLDTRGLQWRLPDGSVHVDFYEQWLVPPAQAADAGLRRWLADSGRFAAVVGPGSRMVAAFVLEGELTAFQGDPAAGVARAELGILLLDERTRPPRVVLQRTLGVTAPLSGDRPDAVAQALAAALSRLLAALEGELVAALR